MLDRIDVSLGPATDSHATAYLRPVLCAGVKAGPGWRLRGVVRGPRCLYARTLASESAIIDLGTDPTPLAKVQISEPCFWTPDLPYLYDMTVELLDGDTKIAEVNLSTGFKRFAVDRRRFWIDQSPHVLRAWRAPIEAAFDLRDVESALPWREFREARLALWTDSPSETLIATASLHGVLVASGSPTASTQPAAMPLDETTVSLVTLPLNACLLGGESAVVATRFTPSLSDALAARAACEQLQRDCAPFTDLAGYVV